jgi:phospho-N-acetylmuramoyl-pentapeptide-transferase
MTVPLAILLIPVTFVLTALWAPWLIGWLRRLKFGKQIRLEGPRSHFAKSGTPTMGGWLFIVPSVLIALIVVPQRASLLPALAAMLVFGIAGALDDYANMKSKAGVGFRVRHKFFWHGLIALALAAWLYASPDLRVQRLPGGGVLDLGWLLIPIAALAIFSCAAGVNEIDGLDGLAGGTAFAAFGSYLALALVGGATAIGALAATICGAILGFLWFNVNPARVFMGDTGALALGAGLAVIAFQLHWGFLLLVVGALYVVELISVILQVGYFKLTHGRRIFKMAPLHHHFEESGWPEPLVVQRFWLLALAAGALGVALGLT